VNELGKLLIVFGAVILLVGVVLLGAGRLPWIGRLPGDINIQRGNWSLHVPIVTSLLLSALLTVILYLIGRR
jgi:membrane protein implicated in regulation of membrane protease activity